MVFFDFISNFMMIVKFFLNHLDFNQFLNDSYFGSIFGNCLRFLGKSYLMDQVVGERLGIKMIFLKRLLGTLAGFCSLVIRSVYYWPP